MSRCKVDGPALWRALDRKRARLGLSWRGVGRELGISQTTFTRIQTPGNSLDGHILVTMLVWLGLAGGIVDFVIEGEDG